MTGPLTGTQVGKADLAEPKFDHNKKDEQRCEP
jgi:hypothetical protein